MSENKMKSYTLEHPTQLIDLVDRYNNEKIHLLYGRRPKLAFSPSADLLFSWENIDITKIKNFCQTAQSENSLVTGLLSYDLGLYTHNLNPRNKADFPLVLLYSFENWVEEDEGHLIVKYRDEKFLKKILQLADQPTRNSVLIQDHNGFQPMWSLSRYESVFNKVKKYIESGDIYQINLTYPLVATSSADAKDIFLQTQAINQASMAGLFQSEDFDLISLSPETFINIENGKIETFPIKGTRAKRKNMSDNQVEDSLLKDEKERAELNMISDLLRNDLGMVCTPRSIKIESQRNTTRLSQVIHTYSHIVGKLSPGISSIEALLKVFPGGSISGCPKKRALEIIDELEEYSRGPYTGSLFTLDPNDNLEANILIRTLVKKDKSLSLPVGGGIVFDSEYRAEYKETLDKALSITKAFSQD